MGLKETFQSVGDVIFAAFGNVQKTGLTYTSKADGYTPGTGVSENDTDHTVDGYLLEYETEEIDNQAVLSTDRRFLMQIQKFPLISPKEGDELLDDEGNLWRVKKKYKDPADVFWDIQLRLPS